MRHAAVRRANAKGVAVGGAVPRLVLQRVGDVERLRVVGARRLEVKGGRFDARVPARLELAIDVVLAHDHLVGLARDQGLARVDVAGQVVLAVFVDVLGHDAEELVEAAGRGDVGPDAETAADLRLLGGPDVVELVAGNVALALGVVRGVAAGAARGHLLAREGRDEERVGLALAAVVPGLGDALADVAREEVGHGLLVVGRGVLLVLARKVGERGVDGRLGARRDDARGLGVERFLELALVERHVLLEHEVVLLGDQVVGLGLVGHVRVPRPRSLAADRVSEAAEGREKDKLHLLLRYIKKITLLSTRSAIRGTRDACRRR